MSRMVMTTLLLMALLTSAVKSMEMLSDPVNGEMIMSTTYTLDITNGQQLRFDSKETLTQFRDDPLVGLGEVMMLDNRTTTNPITALCPICGMDTHAPNGPQVLMQHGDQRIYTCSLHHAHQVHDGLLTYVEEKEVSTSQPVTQDKLVDPINGESATTTKYALEMINGQQLHFESQETLTQFMSDPMSGLGEVESVQESTATPQSPITALCPVCGMETNAPRGPQVSMKHGNQRIYTCSMHHAHQVHDTFLTYYEASAASPAQDSTEGFCAGTGTTMRNGFGWFSTHPHGISPCILLWFPNWVLNTPWRYMGGCIGIIICSIFNEYLLHLRRILRKEGNLRKSYQRFMGQEESKVLLRSTSQSYVASNACVPSHFRRLSVETQHLVQSLLHGMTIFLAYMLMLVSMTYDEILFFCCIVGYIIGYYIFGERREVLMEEPL